MTTMRTEQNKIQKVYRFWKMQLFDGCLRGAVSIGEVAGDKHRSAAAILQLYFVVAIICFGLSAVVVAKEGFVTATFGNAANVVYLRTLKIERELMHFDLSSLPKGTKIQRADLTPIYVPTLIRELSTLFVLQSGRRSVAEPGGLQLPANAAGVI
jgi:hypothetical protein